MLSTQACRYNGIPMGAINDLAAVVQHPQVKARGVLVETDHPAAGKVPVVGVPIRLSATPGSVRTPAPVLGQHTEEVMREVLGVDAAAFNALRMAGAFGAGAS